MSAPGEHRAFQWAELNEINRALGTLRRLGISELDPVFSTLYRARAQALGKLGLVKPRTTTLLKLLPGLSPGQLRLFQDAERGWLVEATEKPGARPVYRYVGDDIAGAILKEELTEELEAELMTPQEEYIA